MKRTVWAPLAALVLLAGCGGGAGTPSIPAAPGGAQTLSSSTSNSSTAQSIDIQLDTDTFVYVTDGGTYNFNRAKAATHYTNTLDPAAPQVSCSGGSYQASKGSKPIDECQSSANQPAAMAPAVDNNGWGMSGGAFVAFLNKNRCTFWAGGTLPSTTYTQSVKVKGLVAGTYTFTWTYDVTPTGAVAPQTAWDGTGDAAGSTTVTIPGLSGWIASESVLHQFKNSRTKVSFDLGGTGQGTVASRISGFTATVTDSAGNQLYQFTPTPLIDDSQDFVYNTNAGTNLTGTTGSDTGLLFEGYAASAILNNPAAANPPFDLDGYYVNFQPSTPLPTERATFDTGSFQLTVPSNVTTDFLVTFAGTVKGNSIDSTSTGGSQQFSVVNHVHISTPAECAAN